MPILIGIYADECVCIRLEDFISMKINIHNKMEGQDEKRNNKMIEQNIGWEALVQEKTAEIASG